MQWRRSSLEWCGQEAFYCMDLQDAGKALQCKLWQRILVLSCVPYQLAPSLEHT